MADYTSFCRQNIAVRMPASVPAFQTDAETIFLWTSVQMAAQSLHIDREPMPD